MSNRDQTRVAEAKRVERTFESIAGGERDCGLYFDRVTGELRTGRDDDGQDVDRLPATRMAREGFFVGSRLLAMSRLERLHFEKTTLSKVPGLLRSSPIQSLDDHKRCGVVCELQTDAGRRYTLWIRIGKAYPNKPPKMYVIRPKPFWDCRGRKLSSVGSSYEMHLLDPDEHGHPQICHYRDSRWTPNVTLYEVLVKGRLWLEAYERHRETGKDMDHYLPHMAR